jgi:putative ABC transport system permease protein
MTPLPAASRSPSLLGVLLTQFIGRYWKRELRRSLLLLALLSLGIAVFLAIRLANRAALSSFSNFTGVVTRQTDAILSAPMGDLPEALLDSLRPALAHSGIEIIPVLEVVAAPPRSTEETQLNARPPFTLTGLDLVALQNLAARESLDRTWFNQDSKSQQSSGDTRDLWHILQSSNAAFCSEALARREGLSLGAHLPLVLNDQTLFLEISGIIPGREDQPSAPHNLLILDLPTLQTLAGKTGRLDRIEFLFPPKLAPTQREAWLQSIRQAAGPNTILRSPESRKAVAESMTAGFRLNLTILSLLALLVGLYLIFQSLDAAVVRRRSEIAILRALGVRPSEIRAAWLLEAALLGLAGGLLGCLGGWLLAQAAVGVVSQTVNSLYFASHAQAANLHPTETVAALLLAVVASLIAGWFPAQAAARTPPAQLLAHGGASKEPPPKKGAHQLGIALTLLAALLSQAPPLPLPDGGRFPIAGYLSAFLAVVGGGLWTGHALRTLARGLAPLIPKSPAATLARSHLSHPTSRHRWAVAALLCAMAMTGGMAILVASFEASVTRWIERTLQADLYLTSDANQSASSYNRIPAATWRTLTSLPDVAEADVALILPVELPQGTVRIVGSQLAFAHARQQFTWLTPPKDPAIFDPAQNENLCLVSEAFTERFRIGPGATLTLPTPQGPKALRITGVYTDYGDEKGIILVERTHLARWVGSDDASTLSLVARSGVDPLVLQNQIRTQFPGIAVLSHAHLRNEVLRIFRQTFAITDALEGIGVLVALLGLGTTLASILLERKAELTTLRALGMEHRAIAAATAWEGTGLALCGVLGGLLTSVAFGAILIFVINKQSFGWTLIPVLPARALFCLGLGVTLCGAFVAWMVGRWGSALPADREA